ncbi:hypothetical protein AB0C51_25515 [Streptomyces pathocidini]|uniref:hypothetical protein n=1 Tax=Streptomyces pathocidini TaxID=1650571 RepID=UPI0033FCA73D
MEYDMTSEEQALLSYLEDRLHEGENPNEDELAEQRGEGVRRLLRSLADKQLISLGLLPEGSVNVVYGLSPEAQESLGIHRDATQ